MDIIGISIAIIAVTLIILAGFMISAFIEIKKMAIALQEFISQTETDMKPLLRDLHKSLSDINVLTAGTSERVEDVKDFMEAIGDTGRNLRTINHVVGAVSGTLAGTSAWITGARVAGKFIIDKIGKKKRR